MYMNRKQCKAGDSIYPYKNKSNVYKTSGPHKKNFHSDQFYEKTSKLHSLLSSSECLTGKDCMMNGVGGGSVFWSAYF